MTLTLFKTAKGTRMLRTVSQVVPSRDHPHFASTMMWSGKALSSRHWICEAGNGIWGFGPTPASAHFNMQRSAAHHDCD